MSPKLPRWIAHRGGGSLAPENTLLGIRRAAAAGFAAVEFDVMLSADGTPLLIHDETLERTTNGTGLVCATPDSELFSFDAGEGESIPTLEQAAALCRELELLTNVEIKPAPGLERRTAEVVIQEVLRLWHDAAIPPLISSFSCEALAMARDLAPGLARGLLLAERQPDWRCLVRELAVQTVHCPVSAIDAGFMAEAASLGLRVLVYTVNDEKLAKLLFAQGVQAVFTDDLRPGD